MNHTFLSGSGMRICMLQVLAVLSFAFVHADPIMLSGTGVAVIDGVLDAGEWSSAGTYEFLANTPEKGTTPATFYFMNDDVDMFFALVFERSAADPANGFCIEFDNDGSNSLSDGDDAIVANPSVPNGLADDCRQLEGNILTGRMDTYYGGSNDGFGDFANDGEFSIFELSHPLNSGEIYDVSLFPGSEISTQLSLRMIGRNADYPEGFGDTDIRHGNVGISISPYSVPEPSTLSLLFCSLCAVPLVRGGKKKNRK